jgi:hypothetical protein
MKQESPFAEKAKLHRHLIDDNYPVGQIRAIVAAADVVACVWPNSAETKGVGVRIIKGQKAMAEFAASRQAHYLKIDAIPCRDLEHAVALQQVLGEPGFN